MVYLHPVESCIQDRGTMTGIIKVIGTKPGILTSGRILNPGYTRSNFAMVTCTEQVN